MFFSIKHFLQKLCILYIENVKNIIYYVIYWDDFIQNKGVQKNVEKIFIGR